MITKHVPFKKIDAFLAALDQADSVVIECHRTQYDWVVSYQPVVIPVSHLHAYAAQTDAVIQAEADAFYELKPVTELSAYWQSKEQEINQFASSVW